MWMQSLTSAALVGLVAAGGPAAVEAPTTGGSAVSAVASVAGTASWTGATRSGAHVPHLLRQAEPVRVVGTLPIYAELAQEIGGGEVTVRSIADPREDAHFVRPRPSFAAAIRQADLLITTGLDLELWLPTLLDRAGNADVAEGRPGYVTAYSGIELLDVPEVVDRSQGDIHIYGNPHIYTDPVNVIQIARNITEGLKNVAPDRAAVFDRGFADFADRIHRALFGDRLVELLRGETLEQLARRGDLMRFLRDTPFEGRPLIEQLDGWLGEGMAFRGEDLICYHKNWAYFENRFGVRCAEFVESKPGIPPTPGHVSRLIDMMQNQGIDVIFAANYFDRSRVESVARRAGATAVIVPLEPGGAVGVESYVDVVDRWVAELARAFGATT
ncbi:MAG: metal ABC transporter substrate-binding protein [Gemmatimonadota bacterium]